jgi:hypothetical protein
MDVFHKGVDVFFSKTMLKNLFNNLIIKKKMMLGFLNTAFLLRVFFFPSETIYGISNLEINTAYKFKYSLYDR